MTRQEAIIRLEEGAPFSELYDETWELALSMAIGVLKSEPGWTPIDKALPEYDTLVLVQLRTGDMFAGTLTPYADGTGMVWDLPAFPSYLLQEDVIAWMPLPEPYKIDGEVRANE